MLNPLERLVNLWLRYYERWGLYKANPCDVDAHPWLKPFGRAAAHLTSLCPCCTGVRILVAVAITAIWPVQVASGTAVLYAALVAKETIRPTKEPQEPQP